MTDQQADTMTAFARQAMPKSSEAQGQVLRAAILPFPEDVVADAIVKHAAESEFISTVSIMSRVRAALGGGAMDRLQKEIREARQRVAQIPTKEDPTVTQARDFCRRSDPAQLAGWRAEIEAANPTLAKRWQGKETWDAVTLACMIHTKFGKIPAACWGTRGVA